MGTPVIATAYPTLQGKENGVFTDLQSEDRSTALIDHAVAWTGLAAAQIDDLLWGCAQERKE